MSLRMRLLVRTAAILTVIGALVVSAASLHVAAARALGAEGARETVSQSEGVSITFLANEGVLLSSGTSEVLIDALYLKYKTYAIPVDSTRAALARARPPFDGVDLILATHWHGDHFHPEPVAAHLRANPGATLLTSRQVVDSLRGRAPAADPISSRVVAHTVAPGTSRQVTVGGIRVELLGLPHGGHPGVEHLGYIVELGGRRVLHVGDADITELAFAPFRLDTARIDVALVPYQAVTSRAERRVVEQWIRPRQVVAFHVDERDGQRVSRAVEAALPGAITFFRSLETRRW